MNRFLLPALLMSLAVIFSFTYAGKIQGSRNPGKQIRYSYRSESLAYSDVGQLYTTDSLKNKTPFFARPGIQGIQGTISCEITQTLLAEQGDSQLVVFQVHRPEINIIQKGFGFDTDLIKKEIGKPVFVNRDRQGNIRMVFTDSAISSASESIIKDMISRFQFVSAPGNPAAWQTNEINPVGSYTAAYRLSAQENGQLIYIKENKGYNNIPSYQDNQHTVVESRSVISVDPLHTILQEDISESFITLAGDDTVTISGNKTAIRKLDTRHANEKSSFGFFSVFAGTGYKKPSTLSMQLTEEDIIKTVYTNTLGHDTWETICHELPENPSKEKTEELTMKLRALATLRPGTCEQIVNRLKKEPLGTAMYTMLSGALGRTATAEASSGLARLVWERQSEKDLVMDLLPLLAINPNPSPYATDIVQKLGFELKNDTDIATTAQLALGAIVFHTGKTEPLQSDKVTRYIIKKTNGEKDTLQKLLVLGNTGNQLILPEILPLIRSKNVSVEIRLRAITALRFIKQPEITIVLESLTHSTDSSTSTTAGEVTAFRNNFIKEAN